MGISVGIGGVGLRVEHAIAVSEPATRCHNGAAT
jgi:hypothetical protein